MAIMIVADSSNIITSQVPPPSKFIPGQRTPLKVRAEDAEQNFWHSVSYRERIWVVPEVGGQRWHGTFAEQ
jgi:hypothetical protein